MESLGKIAKSLKRGTSKTKPDSHLHSPAHLLADELSVKLNDRKHFALYLGMAKKHGDQFLRKILGEVLEAREVKNAGRLFSFLVKKYNDEQNSKLQAPSSQ